MYSECNTPKGGFPHSDICGSKLICQLPEAYRRLSRLSSPFIPFIPIHPIVFWLYSFVVVVVVVGGSVDGDGVLVVVVVV